MTSQAKAAFVQNAKSVIQNRIKQLDDYIKEINDFDDGIGNNQSCGVFNAGCLGVCAVILACFAPFLINEFWAYEVVVEGSIVFAYIGAYSLAAYLLIDAIHVYIRAGEAGKVQELLNDIRGLRSHMQKDLAQVEKQMEELDNKAKKENVQLNKGQSSTERMVEFRTRIDQYKGANENSLGMSLAIAYWVTSGTLTTLFLMLTCNWMAETVCNMFSMDSDAMDLLVVLYIALGVAIFIGINYWIWNHMTPNSMSALLLSLCSGPAAVPAGILITFFIMVVVFIISAAIAIGLMILVLFILFEILGAL